MAELASDPKYVAAREREERERDEREALLRRAEEPILSDLRRVGVDVSTTWELIGSDSRRPGAAAVLLRHLPHPYPPAVRLTIGRALVTQATEKHWSDLLRAYREEQDAEVRDPLADALAARGRGRSAELIELASDPANGRSRELLLERLASSSEGRAALNALAADPEVGDYAARLLRRQHKTSSAMPPPVEDANVADLIEVASVSVDLRELPNLARQFGQALEMDRDCVDAVVDLARTIAPEETRSVDCRTRGGPIRVELFCDDYDAIDLYLLAYPSLRAEAERAVASYLHARADV